MKKFSILLVFVGLSLFGIFRFFNPNEVRILDDFDFSEGEWKLVKGNRDDSVGL